MKRLDSGPDSVEHIGILPTGELYIDREIFGDDMPDFTLTNYLPAAGVDRLKAELSNSRLSKLTDSQLLEFLSTRFKNGYQFVEWLHAIDLPTVHRADDWLPGRPEVIDPGTAAKLHVLASNWNSY